MGVLEHDLQAELDKFKSQLEQVRLTQRDTSFKFNREQQVLKRVVSSLANHYRGSHELNQSLDELSYALQQPQDISELIPQLAVLERMLKQRSLAMDKHHHHLDRQLQHSAETLLRVAGLPPKIKRDLRDLLSFSAAQPQEKTEQALRLLDIYQRAVKIQSINPNLAQSDIARSADRELLDRLCIDLQQLITELDFNGESGEQLNDIRSKLLLGVNPHTLLELTLEVLRLVVNGSQMERKSAQAFLEQVNLSVGNNLKSVTQNLEQSQNYLIHRQQMNSELGNLVSRSQTTLAEQTDIAQLKQKMTPLLREMTSLTERLHLAEQREQALFERMLYSKDQMAALSDLAQNYHHRLEEQALRAQLDPLTKIYNRSYFTERLEHEYRRWIRGQHNFRIVLFDIDNFKSINDSFGYTAGDKALTIIARTIKKELSDGDTVARFAGEEFMVLMPERSDSDSYQIIHQIQLNVSKLPFKFRDKNLTITVSAACLRFADSDTPETVLDRLNLTLNQAKSSGSSQLAWK
ncbi:GGDEF domain-containing protein [Vibrio sp. HDW18]|uniref:GGDEF domain-containing protein n=1 Tax=Vibrio sp. HDW18 TaxID=2714948 RepID=UPI00140B2E7F|nr:GGDEF domain-containing protein [Vibrio sp. HDW18]QIL86075.1 GGDEF domain-containing protein [Vibrio sp. HDW18]